MEGYSTGNENTAIRGNHGKPTGIENDSGGFCHHADQDTNYTLAGQNSMR